MTIRHTGLHLLPPNATEVEKAISLVSAEFRDAIPWEDLLSIFDPEQCPERLLPWLATVFSVDLWFDTWPTARKRDVIARAIELHRIKGTLGGLEEYLALADVGLARATTPPALFFTAPEEGDAFRDWYLRLPEVRVYHYRSDATNDAFGNLAENPVDQVYPADETPMVDLPALYFGLDEFLEDEGVVHCFCLGDPEFPVQSGIRAVMIENGVETELGIETSNEWDARPDDLSIIERLYFPEARGLGLYLTDIEDVQLATASTGVLDDAYLHDGSDRRYVGFIRRTGQHSLDIGTPMVRGREVVDSEPIRVMLDSETKGFWFLDYVTDPAVLSYPIDLLFDYYDSWRVVDPANPITFGPRFSFLDFDRFGIADYTAELLVDFTEPKVRGGLYLDHAGGDCLIEGDYTRLGEVMEVVNVAKAKRDDVLIDLDYGIRPSLRRTYRFADLRLR